MPDSTRSPQDMSLRELREFTACRLVREADPGAAIKRLRGRKDMTRRVLFIYIEWDDDSSNSKRSLTLRNARSLLERWLWDGWRVSFENFDRPRP